MLLLAQPGKVSSSSDSSSGFWRLEVRISFLTKFAFSLFIDILVSVTPCFMFLTASFYKTAEQASRSAIWVSAHLCFSKGCID